MVLWLLGLVYVRLHLCRSYCLDLRSSLLFAHMLFLRSDRAKTFCVARKSVRAASRFSNLVHAQAGAGPSPLYVFVSRRQSVSARSIRGQLVVCKPSEASLNPQNFICRLGFCPECSCRILGDKSKRLLLCPAFKLQLQDPAVKNRFPTEDNVSALVGAGPCAWRLSL